MTNTESLRSSPGESLRPFPRLSLHLAVAPMTVRVGDQATVTLTVMNESPYAATDVAVMLPVPDGATPVAHDDVRPDGRIWKWEFDQLTGGSVQVVQARLQLTNTPAGEALLACPELTARELARPLREIGGAIVVDSAAAEVSTSVVAGKPTALRRPDGRVEVVVPAGVSDTDFHLSYRCVDAVGGGDEEGQFPPVVAGFRRGLGIFFLDAVDARGNAVNDFREPVTINVRYTPEQLQTLGISEADLTLFGFDEQAHQWAPEETVVDCENHVASARVTYSRPYQLSDGSRPSDAFIPSVQGWQVGLYSGNASFTYPIDVPAGPGGIRPDLQLSYNSASSDGTGGLRPKQQAGWVGKGWSLDTGAVSANKIAVSGTPYYSLVLNGVAADLVRAEPLVDNPAASHPTDWAWRPIDESFIKVRVVKIGYSTDERGGFYSANPANPKMPYQRYMWQVWKKDGTRYDFGADAWWGFNDCAAEGGYAYMETYRWHLSTVVDPHGNTISYTYDRDSHKEEPTCLGVQGMVDRDVWLTAITWGANISTGASDRYKVEFVTAPRQQGEDSAFDGAENQYGWDKGQPRETRKLVAINVASRQSTSWELMRQYRFSYDTSLTSDRTIWKNGVRAADPESAKLTLTSIQRVGKDGAPGLPKTTFTYGTKRGIDVYPNGDWNRLTHVNNGQGGTVSFTYDTIAAVPPKNDVFKNNRRVTTKTVTDGRGNSYVWRYAYTNPAYNCLGSLLYPSGATQQYANSAVLYYNKYRAEGGSAWLLHKPYTEFRGHSLVVETDPNGNQTEHYFFQGDVGCNPTATGGQVTSDQRFTQLRDRETLKGKEYRTVVKRGSSTVLTEDLHTFAVEFYDYGPTPFAGLWRAFSYESETLNKIWEGTAAPITKTTRFFYNPELQGGMQFGNLTNQHEYSGSTLYRQHQYRYVALNTETSYIVDRRIAEGVKDGAGVQLALTNNAYDGNIIPWGPLSKGDLTLVRKYYDLTPSYAFPSTTIHSVDTSYGYDPYGNRTTVTTYAQAGTRLANTFSTPGNGSAATTTTTTYDSVFHAFSVEQQSPPNAQGIVLIDRAGYDYRMGVLTSVTDPNNNTVSAEYDSFGRMIKLIKPGDTAVLPTIETTYADNEQPFRYTVLKRDISGNAAGRRSSQFYDGLGRQIQTKSETQHGTQTVVTDMRYDGLDNRTAQSQPRFVNDTSATFLGYTPVPSSGMLWTTTTYDPIRRQLVVTTPDNAQTIHRYSIDNGMQSDDVTDPQRHRMQYRTDVFGRLAQVVEVKGTCGNYWGYTCSPSETPWAVDGITTYSYNPLDLLTSVTDAQNNVTTMNYDSLARKLKMTDPDMGIWSYSYNVDGNLITQQDAKNQTITFGYDALNRLISKTLPTGEIIRHTYDENDQAHLNGRGQRTTMTDPSGAHHWAYTQRGEVWQEQLIVNGQPGAYTISRTYRADGQPKTLTYPTGEVLTYHYNDAGQQTVISTSLGVSYLATTYDALGQPLTQIYGNGMTTTSTYEPLTKRLSTIATRGPGGTAFQRTYTYDLAGNVQTIANPLANETLRYTYDQRDRLVGACAVANAASIPCLGGATFNQTYSYDKIGNLTNKAGASYTYANGKPHAVSAVNGAAYTYDPNGNMLTGASRMYAWNAENQPTRITNGATTETYLYDGDNDRIKKTTVNGGVTATTIYIGGLVEYTGNDVISSYGGVAVRRTRGNPSPTNKGTLTYLHTDHLGSVSATTSGNAGSQGAILQCQSYDPWGAGRSGGINSTEFNYTGQRKDAGTGLLFYNARYYDPALARFVRADSIVPGSAEGNGGAAATLGQDETVALRPLAVDFHEHNFVERLNDENAFTLEKGFWFELSDAVKKDGETKYQWGPANVQSLNRYAYVLNNPLRYIDPTGHESWWAKIKRGHQRLKNSRIGRGAGRVVKFTASLIISVAAGGAALTASVAFVAGIPITIAAGLSGSVLLFAIAGGLTFAAGALAWDAASSSLSYLRDAWDVLNEMWMSFFTTVFLDTAKPVR